MHFKSIFTIAFSLLLVISNEATAQVFAGDDVLVCEAGSITLNAEISGVMGTTAYTLMSQTWTPEAIAGTSINLTDDAISPVQPIGFSFCYFGNTYTNFYIGSNGWVGFTAGQSNAFSSQTLPNTAANVPKNCIMGPWQDWHPGVGNNIGNYIKYQTVGTAPNRKLIVTWDNVPMFSCTSNLGKFQIVLFETSNIIRNNIFTKPICTFSNGGAGTQGIHNLNGTLAYTVPGRNSGVWTASNETWDYMPNGLVWSQNGTPIGTSAAISVSPVQTTDYVASVTLCDGTIFRDTVQVVVGAGVNFENSIVQSTNCSNQIGSIEVIAESASAGPFSYVWQEVASTSPTLQNLDDGTYNLSLTDESNGCIYQETFVVPVNSTLSIETSDTDINCAGASNGTAQVVATSNFPGFTYLWNDPSNGTNPNVENLSPGTYTVQVMDADGCEATAFVIISEPSPLDIDFSETTITCPSGNDGTITASPLGGVGNYSLIWQNEIVTPTLGDLSAGEYSVTLYDGNGCMYQEVYAIDDPEAISADFIVNPPSCSGILDGLVAVQGTGGHGPYTFYWPYNNSTGEILENLTSGDYTVIISDFNNCVDSASVTISPVLQLNIMPSVNSPDCFGENNGSISVSVSGGTPDYTYQWNDILNQTTSSISNLTSGPYSVLVEDANGCQGSLSIVINEPDPLNFTSEVNNPLCFGNSTGSATITPTGGTPNYIIDWEGTLSGFDPSNLIAGTYSFTITDDNNCEVEGAITLTTPAALEGDVETGNALCFATATGQANISANGGIAPYTYSWSQNSINSPSNENLSAGQQTCIVSDQNGCETTLAFMIGQPLALSTSIITTPASCGQNNGTASATTQGGTQPYQFIWDNQLVPDPTEDNFSTGNYTVTIVDANGCQLEQNFNISETQVSTNFEANPDEGLTPLQVEFINTSSGANSYTWDFGDGSAPLITSSSDPVYHMYTTEGLFNAVLYASYDGACEGIDSTHIRAFQISAITKIPNVFSPNGDGYNESFRVLSVNLKTLQMNIFDRWGNMVWEIKNPNEEWTGNGQASGVYFYTLKAEGFDGNTFTHEGTITLVQ
jgi:gliding motility-associated-like protein